LTCSQSGSIFALGNGHIGLRGNLDEGEPNGLPGTYLNGFYETRPLPYAEAPSTVRTPSRNGPAPRRETTMASVAAQPAMRAHLHAPRLIVAPAPGA
jgi:hypothetical protein